MCIFLKYSSNFVNIIFFFCILKYYTFSGFLPGFLNNFPGIPRPKIFLIPYLKVRIIIYNAPEVGQQFDNQPTILRIQWRHINLKTNITLILKTNNLPENLYMN